MKIYTRTGDAGETGLLGGARVRKSALRVEAYGELDELNACLGLAAVCLGDTGTADLVTRIQRDLFALSARIADVRAGGAATPDKTTFPEGQVIALEAGHRCGRRGASGPEDVPPSRRGRGGGTAASGQDGVPTGGTPAGRTGGARGGAVGLPGVSQPPFRPPLRPGAVGQRPRGHPGGRVVIIGFRSAAAGPR